MHNFVRAGRLLTVALATYFAVGCGTAVVEDESRPPQTAETAANQPSEARLAEVHLRVARSAFDQGYLKTAEEMFEKAHKTVPNDARPLVGKGDVLFARRQFGEAAAAYRAALARNAKSFEANQGLGKSLVSEHKYDEGLAAFNAALAIQRDAKLLNMIGVTHEMLGHGELAQKHYREALALQPGNLTARNNLALSLGVSGNYDAALKEIERVVASPGASERYYANQAFIYGLSGRPMGEAPVRAARAAAKKGWDETFFTQTREIAEKGNRTAILALLNKHDAKPAPATAFPPMASLPDMPDMPDTPDTASEIATQPAPAPSDGADSAASATPAAESVSNQPTEESSAAVIPPPPAASNSETATPALAMVQPSSEQTTEPPKQPVALQPAQSGVEAAANEDTAQPAEKPAELAMRSPPAAAPEAPEQAATPEAPEQAAPTVATAAPAASGGAYRVQIGAFKTTKWLSAMLTRLGDDADDILPAQRLDVAYQKDMYMVRSSGLPNLAAARQLCKTLKEREFACFVTAMGKSEPGHMFDIAAAGDEQAVRRFVAGLPAIKSALAPPAAAAASEPTEAPEIAAPAPGIVPPQAPETDTVATLRPAPSAEGSEPQLSALPAPATGPAAKIPDGGEYRIQLAAYRLARDLDRGIAVLKRAAGDLLPPLEELKRAGGKPATAIPFRLRSGPLASQAAAEALCGKLREKGLECLVIRHGPGAWRPLA